MRTCLTVLTLMTIETNQYTRCYEKLAEYHQCTETWQRFWKLFLIYQSVNRLLSEP